MKVIIPMAGKDMNFENKGVCKPLADVMGKPLIKMIAESRPYSFENAIFILLREHQEKYQLDKKLKELFGNKITIVWAEKITEGAPCSILLAKELINTDEDILIDLGDQYLDLTGFMDSIRKYRGSVSGILPVFEYYYWKVGYVAIDENGYATRVEEKVNPPISTHSTACISYFSHGRDYVKYTEQMIKLNHRIKFNNSFFVSMVYNEMIHDRLKVKTIPCEFICPLGNPRGIEVFELFNRPLKWKNK